MRTLYALAGANLALVPINVILAVIKHSPTSWVAAVFCAFASGWCFAVAGKE